MAELRFTLEFTKNLESIAEFIAQDSEILARQFVKNLLVRLESLKLNPELGRIIPEKADAKIREIFYGSYRVVYRVIGNRDQIEVLMVRHAARLR